MADTVTMPKLGFDMAEGTLVKWVVQEGEEVKKGAVLAEIETDKATVEVESSVEGIVRRHLVSEGDVVLVGKPIAIVGTADEEISEPQPGTEEVKAASEQAPGGATPKEMAAGESAPAKEEPGMVGRVAEQGQPAAQGQSPAQAAAQAKTEEQPAPQAAAGPILASPIARRIADERGIDLRQVKGTGPGGRIVRKDVEAFQPGQAQPATAIPTEAAPQAAAPVSGTEPLNKLRAAIGRRMQQSVQQAPHFFVTHEYNVKRLLEIRKAINALLPEEEKVSVNDLIVKAVALTLREFPNLNSSLQGDSIARHADINIGVAVAVENGLLTVVVRTADQKTVRAISGEIRAMAERVRSGKVRSEDIEGSTFSTSNLGMFEVEQFSAIINPPEAAILALSSAREIPVVENGEIKPGWRMKATLSVDHRISDGAEGARFLQALAKYLEEPLLMLA